MPLKNRALMQNEWVRHLKIPPLPVILKPPGGGVRIQHTSENSLEFSKFTFIVNPNSGLAYHPIVFKRPSSSSPLEAGVRTQDKYVRRSSNLK
jgi:hypothetical protein